MTEILLDKSSSISQVQEYLLSIRLTIIGDDDEKIKFVNSSNFESVFDVLDALMSNDLGISDDEITSILNHTLIIINSLSIFEPALPALINQHSVTDKLVILALTLGESEVDHSDIIISIIFKILSNLLKHSEIFNNKSSLSQIDSTLNELILKKLNESVITAGISPSGTTHIKRDLLKNILLLIPQLNASLLQDVLPTLSNILHILLQKPTRYIKINEIPSHRKVFSFPGEAFETSHIPRAPPSSLISNILPSLLYSISHLLQVEPDILEIDNKQIDSKNDDDPSTYTIDQLISADDYYTLTAFLKVNNSELKLSTISTLIIFSLNSNISTSSKNSNVLKVLPYLIQLLKLEGGFTHGKENIDINSLDVFQSDLSTSKKFNPFYILSKLSLNFDFVNEFLLNCNIIKKLVEILRKFNSVLNVSPDSTIIDAFTKISKNKLNNLSDIYLILSSVTLNNEINRSLISNDELSFLNEKLLKFHHQYLTLYLNQEKSTTFHDDINQDELGEKVDEELLVISNHLAISTCYLLRSLSRSVSILRSYLYRTDFIKQFLNLLKIPELEVVSKLNKLDKFKHDSLLQNEILLRTLILAVLSNLLLSFSPLRDKLRDPFGISVPASSHHGNGDEDDEDNIVPERDSEDLIHIISNTLLSTSYNSIKANCLWVLRHIIYNESPLNRDHFIEPIGLEKIFEYIKNYDDDPLIQEQGFNVLRNLTCSSEIHVNKILNKFEYDDNTGYQRSRNGNQFLQFLNDKLLKLNILDSKNDNLVESIIYITVHIAAISEAKRDLIAGNLPLLERIRDILVYSKKSDVKIACIWLVINLTWIENINESTSSRFASDRDVIVIGHGSHDNSTSSSSSHTSGGSRLRSENYEDGPVILENDEDDEEEDIRDEEGDVITEEQSQISRQRSNFSSEVPSNSRERGYTSIPRGVGVAVAGGRNQNNSSNQSTGTRDAKRRIDILNSVGFNKALSDLSTTDNVDLNERIRTALFNLTQFRS